MLIINNKLQNYKNKTKNLQLCTKNYRTKRHYILNRFRMKNNLKPNYYKKTMN